MDCFAFLFRRTRQPKPPSRSGCPQPLTTDSKTGSCRTVLHKSSSNKVIGRFSGNNTRGEASANPPTEDEIAKNTRPTTNEETSSDRPTEEEPTLKYNVHLHPEITRVDKPSLPEETFTEYFLEATATFGHHIVGRLEAHLFRRKDFNIIFRTQSSFGNGCEQWASTIFSETGLIRPEILAPSEDFHDGTIKHGVWGPELNKGDLGFIETIWIAENWRNQGIATGLVDLVKTSGKQLLLDFRWVYMWPTHFCPKISWIIEAGAEREVGWTDRHIENDLAVDEAASLRTELEKFDGCRLNLNTHRKKLGLEGDKQATLFWRAKGARRLGMTKFFCIALDRKHASQKLAAKDDPDPFVQRGEDYWCENTDGVHRIKDCQQIKQWRLEMRFPLQLSLEKLDDGESVKFLDGYLSHAGFPLMTREVVTIPSGGHGTLLHDCMGRGKVCSVVWLVRHFGQKVLGVRDVDGRTAVDWYQMMVEKRRKRGSKEDWPVVEEDLREDAAMLLAIKGWNPVVVGNSQH